ncbi:MAG: tyrosine-type recombinase/integrase [Oligoflexia bacterium]|nr:tyrosine-type recombinase/integrase [Oligoflexia bacterium]MBF0365248.1 tyrosine-type recombinase/integrase [Oligoflexia bacterium]
MTKYQKKHQAWLLEFLDNYRRANKSQHTIDNYKADLQKYITWFEATFPGKFLNCANAKTISCYQQFLSAQNDSSKLPQSKRYLFWGKVQKLFLKIKPLQKTPEALLPPRKPLVKQQALAVASKRRHLSAIKNFYEYLKQTNEDFNKLFAINPVRTKIHAIRLKDEDVEPTKLLTPQDWKVLDNTISNAKERFIIHVLYYGGLRLSELCNLRKDAFNSANFSLKFVRKGGDLHTLYIQRPKVIFQLYKYYLGYLARKKLKVASPYLFPNARGEHLTSRAMYNTILKIMQKANCPTQGLTPHSFRKACASNLYHRTKDLLLVRDYLNHADAKVTQTYIERLTHEPHSNTAGSLAEI